ncbi:nestin [Osmerus eperlanus]|uniref:nestin n=1 Tax=Osmerus eperlanus TaxID=29151 RepID=UPI002E122BFA
MERHTTRCSHHTPLDEERHQMLNLNSRLGTYLGRVRLLEEENEVLRQEVQHLRHNGKEDASRREELENELYGARLEVEVAWRKKVQVEMEIASLGEELRGLSLQRQKVAGAHGEARKRLVESEKEMEEERRAQIWLKEKVRQFEMELNSQTQTHEENVAYLHATLAHARPTASPMPAQADSQLLGLLDPRDGYSQTAARAWQEATEAYEGQVARLEESLSQASTRLAQVGQEKNDSQMKLQALEIELASSQDLKQYLEKRVVQQRYQQTQEFQQLQAHLEALEVEKVELGQQIDELLMNSRGLLQMKMSLGLEVVTYRALLDSESLKVEVAKHQPRSVCNTDPRPSPRGVKQTSQIQTLSSHRNGALSSIPAAPLRSKTNIISITSISTPKSVTCSETHKSSLKAKEEQVDVSRPAYGRSAYPKVLQGSVQFRPQTVSKEVSYNEPLSSPNEQEIEVDVKSARSDRNEPLPQDREEGENRNSDGLSAVQPVVSISHLVHLTGKPIFSDDAEECTNPREILETECPVTKPKGPFSFPEDNLNEVTPKVPGEKEGPQLDLPVSPIHAWHEGPGTESEEAAWMNDGSSGSETEAVMEPTLETGTSSPASESQTEETMFNQPTELHEEFHYQETGPMGLTEASKECRSWKHKEHLEDKVYSDGDEMDTWDQVMERNVPGKKENMNVENDERETQRIALGEYVSAPEQEELDIKNVVDSLIHQDSHMTLELTDTDQDEEKDPEKANDDDSPNASSSWRTELECDSYAQDNTLADTRPLIRYKSDETDANTQASHIEESESSDCDEGRKVGEAGTDAWGESQSKRFGTMEDLCEEAVGETLDEEYNRDNPQTECMISGQAGEYVTPGIGEHADQILRDAEDQSDDETEELTERGESTSRSLEHYDEEGIDKMVEKELEVLSISTYSARFQQHTAEGAEQTERVKANTTDMLKIEGLEQIDPETAPSTHSMHLNESYEYDSVQESSADRTQVPDQGNVFNEQWKMDGDEQNLSIQTPVDLIEEDSITSKLNNLPERQDNLNNSNSSDGDEESSNASQCSQPIARVKYPHPENLVDVVVPLQNLELPTEEPFSGLQDHPMECSDWTTDQGHPQTEAWEFLESPNKRLQSRDRFVEQSQSHTQDTKNIIPECEAGGEVEDICVVQSESPDKMTDECDIFQVQKSEEQPTTKREGTRSFFSSSVQNELWSSSQDTGATHQPDILNDREAEQSNQNLTFGDSEAWETLENLKVANGNTDMEPDEPKAPVFYKEEEQRLPLAKQQLCRDVVEGEDSEEEGVDSWSSGEE